MDMNKEISSVAGETLAMQFALAEICKALLIANPSMRPWVETAFDEAANRLKNLADTAGPSHLGYSVRVAEQIKAMVLSGSAKSSG